MQQKRPKHKAKVYLMVMTISLRDYTIIIKVVQAIHQQGDVYDASDMIHLIDDMIHLGLCNTYASLLSQQVGHYLNILAHGMNLI